MSIAAFHYKDMEDSADAARSAATKLVSYDEELDKKVAKKLANYNGPASTNLCDMTTLLRQKSSALTERASTLKTYADRTNNLIGYCKNADTAVSGTITQLTGEFKKSNAIVISPDVEISLRNTVSKNNQNWLSRISNDGKQIIADSAGDCARRIENWFKYEGGKYIVLESAKALLCLAISVYAIVGAVAVIVAAFTVATPVLAIVAAVASLIVGVIGVVNAVTDVVGNVQAAGHAKDDPAYAKRVDQQNTLTDRLRWSFNRRWVHNIAAGIDTLEFVAQVVSIVSMGYNVLAKGIKWLTCGKFKVADFKLNMINKHDLSTGLSKRLSNFKSSSSNLWGRLKIGDFGAGKAAFQTIAHNMAAPYRLALRGIAKFSPGDILTYSAATSGVTTFLKASQSVVNGDIGDLLLGFGASSFAVGLGKDIVSAQDGVLLFKKILSSGQNFADTFSSSSSFQIDRSFYNSYKKLSALAP